MIITKAGRQTKRCGVKHPIHEKACGKIAFGRGTKGVRTNCCLNHWGPMQGNGFQPEPFPWIVKVLRLFANLRITTIEGKNNKTHFVLSSSKNERDKEAFQEIIKSQNG